MASVFSAARFLASPAIAFAATIALVPILQALCVRWRLFDAHGPLKIHLRPVPRLGGAAIFVAIFAAAVLPNPPHASSRWPFFAAAALVWTAGFADDLRGLSPIFRVAAQFAAGALLWNGSGALGLLASCALVAAMANATNLLDGMDALAAGVSGIIAVAYLALPPALLGSFARMVASSLAAACAAFLFYNWPPAKIFLGDCGSNLLGFVMAFLAVDLYRARPTTDSALVFPLLIAAVPLLDAVLSGLRRIRNRRSAFQGDRSHLYDLMASRGWSVRTIALSLYAVTATLAAIGLYGIRRSQAAFWISAGLGLALLVYVAIRLGSLRGDSVTEKSDNENSSSLKELATNYSRR